MIHRFGNQTKAAPIVAVVLLLLMLALPQRAAAQWATDVSINNFISAAGKKPVMVHAGHGLVVAWVSGEGVWAKVLEEDGREMFPAALVAAMPSVTHLKAVGGTSTGLCYVAFATINGDVHVQAIDLAMPGLRGWSTHPNGVAIGSQADPVRGFAMGGDDIEGPVVAWASEGGPSNGRIVVQRLEPDGTTRFAAGPKVVDPSGATPQNNCDLYLWRGDGQIFVAWDEGNNVQGNNVIRLRSLHGATGAPTSAPITQLSTSGQKPRLGFRMGTPTGGSNPGFLNDELCAFWEEITIQGSTRLAAIQGAIFNKGLFQVRAPWILSEVTATTNSGIVIANIDDRTAYSGPSGGRSSVYVAWTRLNSTSGTYVPNVYRVGHGNVGNDNWWYGWSNSGLTTPQPISIVAAPRRASGAQFTSAPHVNEACVVWPSLTGSHIDLKVTKIRAHAGGASSFYTTAFLTRAPGDQILGNAVALGGNGWWGSSSQGPMEDFGVAAAWTDTRPPETSTHIYAQGVRWEELTAAERPLHDIWIRRASPFGLAYAMEEDFGAEPLLGTPFPWDSPDIWNSLSSSGTVHEPAEWGQTNILHIRLRNRGTQPVHSGRLHVYVSQLNTTTNWMNTVGGHGQQADAGLQVPPASANPPLYWRLLQVKNVQSIGPNGTTVKFFWRPDTLAPALNAGNNNKFCFYVRFEAPDDPLKFERQTIYRNVINDNNIAMKNVAVVDAINKRSTFNVTAPILLGRAGGSSISLEIHRSGPDESEIPLEKFNLSLKFPSHVIGAWIRKGQPGTGIRMLPDSSVLIIARDRAVITGLTAGQDSAFRVEYTFDPKDVGAHSSEFLLSQYTVAGDSTFLEGGLAFDVRPERVVATTGGDSVASERQGPGRSRVRTYQLYLVNRNPGGEPIDRTVFAVTGNASILAVGPPRDSQQVAVSFSRSGERSYVYTCGDEGGITLDSGGTLRPIYLTVATSDTGAFVLEYHTFNANGDTLTSSTVILEEPLLTAVDDDDRMAPVGPGSAVLHCFPNPASNVATVRYMLDDPLTAVSISVIDMKGNRLAVPVESRSLSDGTREATLNIGSLPAGAYMVRLQAGSTAHMTRLQVTR
jgi:hypothetical protein